jgi:hypothetical protein
VQHAQLVHVLPGVYIVLQQAKTMVVTEASTAVPSEGLSYQCGHDNVRVLPKGGVEHGL